MAPVMQANVSESPPNDTALRIASSKSFASSAHMIAGGTVPWHDTSEE